MERIIIFIKVYNLAKTVDRPIERIAARMKVWQKRALAIFLITILAVIPLFMLSRIPTGAVPLRKIVSYCVGDANNDNAPELLAIEGEGKLETGERHGGFLLVCDVSAKADIEKLGYIPPEKIRHRIDLTAIKPIKVQLGDVTGDGINEIAVCVYKTAEFHPIMAKRPFFFNLVDGNLVPMWLGSRLSRPFDDYVLRDIDSDGIDEIVSVEQLEDGKRVLAAYDWRDFGFEMLAQSEAFDGKLIFNSNASEKAETGVTYINKEKTVYLKFSLDGERLTYK